MTLPRYSWPADFPEVVIHTTVRERDSHPAYAAAKTGDIDAALVLVDALIDEAAIGAIRTIVGNQHPYLLPIVADETLGFNAIPDAMAQRIGRLLDLEFAPGEIVQTNKVGHTRAPAFQRLVTPAEFGGEVVPEARYFLVDDHVGLGGTLANLRGFLMARGGLVSGITTLTESRDARHISLRPETRDLLWRLHGEELDQLWTDEFGYGIDGLTEIEAAQLCRQHSVAGIADFLAQAAVEARGRGLAPTLG